MKNQRTVNGRYGIIKRLNNSENGNPRYKVSIGGEIFKTVVDSSFGYAATNFDGKFVSANVGTIRGANTIRQVYTSE